MREADSDHIGFSVSGLRRSKVFDGLALALLGIGVVMEVTAEQTGSDACVAFDVDGSAFFWNRDGPGPKGCLNVAIAATSRAAVDAFRRAALAGGGKDNGSPGLQPHYHPYYYGAFILDPDDHDVETVRHRSE